MTSGSNQALSFEKNDAAEADDGFLLREGLDLLFDFRSIANEGVRDHIRAMIKAIAAAQAE